MSLLLAVVAVGAVGSAPAAAGAPPTIDVWYGDVQTVGEHGRTQQWANVLGNVSDIDDTVTSLTYSLNGGPDQPLTIGRDNHPRLVRYGDFNVEIDRADLLAGDNAVVITATDEEGNRSHRTVTLVNTPSVTWPLPTSVRWDGVTTPSEVVDVVDGRWSASSSGARIVETGYDRLFAVGDMTWTDYEVEVPVTIHDMDTNVGGVGLFMRWTGHTEEPPHEAGMQPRLGWQPSGSLAWYRARFGHPARVELATDEEDVLAADTSGFSLAMGSTYVFRARVQRTPAGDDYRMTVFPAGQPESAGVTVTALDTAFRKDAGSVLFIAHRAAVTFGDITVTEIDGEPPPPPPNEAPVAADDAVSTAVDVPVSVDVLANDSDPDGSLVPSSVAVASGPASGSVSVDPASGAVRYAPNPGFVGSDAFSYTVDDDDGATSNVATVSVTVSAGPPPPNEAPVAVDDAVSTAVDVPVTVDVLANDSDSDGSLVPSSVAVVDGPASGSVSVEPASGAVTYAPNPAFEGSDAFTYTMDDDDGATSNVATVSVTVSAAPPPPSSGLVSDEFSTPSLGSHWSWFDPVGDASRVATGSHAALSVPEGVSHDLWTGALRAPRLLQSADDVDFEVEVKIDSPVTSAYQFQGLVVQEDADDLIRFEVHHDGGSPRVFVATITDGVASARKNVAAPAEAPYWLRLGREGDTWTFEVSGDGISWSTVGTFGHVMSVAQVGVFVGNHTPSPQHTAAVDYFRVTSTGEPPPTPPPTTTSTTTTSTTTTSTTTPTTTSTTTPTTTSTTTPTSTSTSSTSTTSTSTTSTTSPPTPPPPARRLVSDEFSTSSLGSHWSWFDPVGDASRVATGSHAALSVPEGVSHDLWTGALRAPRLLQSADDVDFEVEVKIDSPVTSAYQFQGLVVQQDADDLIRFEVHHDGGSPRVFVATITDGVASERRNVRAPAEAPYWLRVAREGDTWTFQSSGDGVTWNTVATVTHAMSVAQAGVFVGNHTPSPQHTAAIDYFRVS